MSDERKRIGDLFGVIATACAELCELMGGTMSTGASAETVTDAQLDDPRGWWNPVVKRDPKRWTGEPMVGRPFSDTSAEYLDAVAEFKDWASGEDEKKARGNGPDSAKHEKYARYGRRDAASARAWAKRLRAGWTPPTRDDAPPSSAAPAAGGFNGGAAPPAADGWDDEEPRF